MRKRIIAIMLAFSFVVSGLPANVASAAEVSDISADEAVIVNENTNESEANEDTDESEADEGTGGSENAESESTTAEESITEAVDEIRRNSSASDHKELEISEDAKMAGSNGVLYEDVRYLSAKTVMSMDEDAQSFYYNVCDEIAYYKESGYDLEDVVIAVDAEGTIYFAASIPTKVLDDIQREMVQGITDRLEQAETVMVEEETVSETITEERGTEEESTAEESETEEESTTEEVATETETEEESTTEEAATETRTEEESTTEEVASETRTEEESTTEEVATETEEESTSEETEAEEESTSGETEKEETEKEETEIEEIEIEETEIEEEAATETEFIVADENMDMLPDFEEETFDVIETVKVDHIIDLGYGSIDDSFQISTIAPTNYFYNQLTAEEQMIYNTARPKFTAGSNSFSYQIRYLGSFNWNPICHAVSALWLTYPDKTDWMAKPGSIRAKGSYVRGSSVVNYTISFDKSKYFSSSLDSKAKTQIQTLANEAQLYAAENYPNSPVYGIVKYFDSWICENNYYEMLGTLDNIKEQSASVKKIYYYCHSAYGILLSGYGVCESYAKAMSRLLDAVGIPNVYVLGDTSGGFHAWNYVQMPNGSWYLVDSTWNDSTDSSQTWSRGTYLLIASDGNHIPTGASWSNERNFNFPALADVKYTPITESISFGTTLYNLKPNEKAVISVSGLDYISNAPKTWSSSNAKVAKVDSKGKVTAVAPGYATITLAAAGMTASCDVYVDQVKAVTSANTNKNSDTLSFGISGTQGTDAKSVVLNVNMGNSLHNAEWMRDTGKVPDPVITYSNKKVNVATASIEGIEGNQIKLKIKPNVAGTTNVKVSFAGKVTTIKVSVGNVLSEDWFKIDKVEGGKTPYTGKAIKPKVTKTTTEKVTYKVSYLNNKNAGMATVKITGTGKFGGDIVYNFEITPIDIKNAEFSKTLKSKVYNGGANPPATTVKLGKKTLKANTDYTVLYNGAEMSTVPAGNYTITIKGRGNYAGTVTQTQNYTVTKNTIAKVTAACPSIVKYTGKALNPVTVKIGKNILPESDYTVVYHIGSSKDGREIKNPLVKGKYTAVITVKEDGNLTTTAKKKEIVKKITVK